MRDEILRSLKEQLDANVRNDEWDEPPLLCMIVRGTGGMLMFEPMPVGSIWDKGPVHQILHVIAHITRSTSNSGWKWLQEDEALLGVALFSEGWAVSSDVKEGDYATIQAYMEAGGRLADHPSGVEVKTVNAVLTDKSMLMLTHFRGGETIAPNEGDVSHQVSGRIPDGLSEILDAFTGASA